MSAGDRWREATGAKACRRCAPHSARSDLVRRRCALDAGGGVSQVRHTFLLRLRRIRPKPARAPYWLLELILDLVESGLGASVVEIAAGCASGANRADNFIADLDHDTATQQK